MFSVLRKRGDQLRSGDRVIAPRQIWLPGDAASRLDLLRALHGSAAEAGICVRGAAITQGNQRR